MKLTLVALALALSPFAFRQDQEPVEAPPRQQAFALQDLVAAMQTGGQTWNGFLDRPTLSCGIYRLPAGGTDGQSPHASDEVYHVLAGKAKLRAGTETFDVGPGSIVFVEREVEHRFLDIEEDLEVLVFFAHARKE